MSIYNNRVAILATMHNKEKVISPLLKEHLGINLIVRKGLNTDIFGTFTREIKRPDTQIITARLKAKKALKMYDEEIAIASEGSFAPHPLIPYIYANREIIIFLDQENDLEIIGEVFSMETNFNHQTISSLEEAEEFAQKVGFPEHGLVISFDNISTGTTEFIKGITSKENLINSVETAIKNTSDNKFHIETDMRAMYNPTRMKNIAFATQDLINKINSLCPQCHTPGFMINQKIPGLPCELCHQPTSLIKAVIFQCQKCGFTQQQLFPNNQEFADPSLCEYCNP
jgi:predicted Zn-ribbon and HTH transcriptional regulator